MPFPSIGLPELLIVLIIALLVLGPGKLPEVGSALGRTIRDFRRATSEVDAALQPTEASTLPSSAPAPSSSERTSEQSDSDQSSASRP